MSSQFASPYGYVAPTITNSELNDYVLRRFLQTVVVGITSMDPKMVRPRWQPEPPNEPDFEVDWAAIGVISRSRDMNAAVIHATDNSGNGSDAVWRNEILEVLSSFYGPSSEQNSELFAMGLELAQNREAFYLNGFGLVEVRDTLTVPALIKERWLMGMDVPFRIRRQQIYTYAIPNLEEAIGTITTDQGFVVPFKVVVP